MRVIFKLALAVLFSIALIAVVPGAFTYHDYYAARQAMWQASADAEKVVEQGRHDPQAEQVKQKAHEAMERYVLAARRWRDVLMCSG
jgi:hypothetical protein